MIKLVYGVGISEKGEFKRTVATVDKRVATKEYRLWKGLLERCYSEKYQQKRPTYLGCSVSEDFKYFQRFAKWCQRQIGFGLDGYHIDKDILICGNRVYGEDTCVFVPSSINLALIKCNAARGDCPVGVSWNKQSQKYIAQCNTGDGCGPKYLGSFSTPEAAHTIYKAFKEVLIKQLASEYQHVLDPRTFKALLSYEVNIDD